MPQSEQILNIKSYFKAEQLKSNADDNIHVYKNKTCFHAWRPDSGQDHVECLPQREYDIPTKY